MKTYSLIDSHRTLLIATKHQKERVIAPLFKSHFNLNSKIVEKIDTDSLGTFSGEMIRVDDPLITARKKCSMAMDAEGFDLCIASEGSFGPHPNLFFVGADEEWLVCIDRRHGFEFTERIITTETNFSATTVSNWNDLFAFATQIGFPEHGLIMRKKKDDFHEMQKGINDWNYLRALFEKMIANSDSLYVETDMRAHQNPTRMKIIETLTNKLIDKIKSHCPSCNYPGFGIEKFIPGLPCSRCGSETKSIQSMIKICSHCNYEMENEFISGKRFEDPMNCDYCNP